VSGLIFDPVKNEIFYAEKDNGAYFNNQRIRVSQKNQIDDCLFGTGGAIDNSIDVQFRKLGSAALDLAYVASGRYDGYFQKNLNLWDIAAGLILVKEAGGIINQIDLNSLKDIKVIASSANINRKLIEKLGNF
jgi:myo-inositol-1(or 4)-monophosphatase